MDSPPARGKQHSSEECQVHHTENGNGAHVSYFPVFVFALSSAASGGVKSCGPNRLIG